MDIAVVGFGKMAGNMAQNLLGSGQRVLGINRSADTRWRKSSNG